MMICLIHILCLNLFNHDPCTLDLNSSRIVYLFMILNCIIVWHITVKMREDTSVLLSRLTSIQLWLTVRSPRSNRQLAMVDHADPLVNRHSLHDHYNPSFEFLGWCQKEKNIWGDIEYIYIYIKEKNIWKWWVPLFLTINYNMF